MVIDRFGDYQDQPYLVWARGEGGGRYRLLARPFHHHGEPLSTGAFKVPGFVKAMKALGLPESSVSAIRKTLETSGEVLIGGSVAAADRIFTASELVAAGFEAAEAEREDILTGG